MGEFVGKPREQHLQEARTIEGNSQAATALVCGILAWFIFPLPLGGFAVVLGVKSWLRARRVQALVGLILGALAIVAGILRILHPQL